MRCLKILLNLTIISLLVSPCFAEVELVTTYLLYSSSFTTAQKNAIKAYGRNSNNQPALRTIFRQYDFDNNLFKVKLTTYTDAENNAVLNALANGKIQKLSSFEIVHEGLETYVRNIQRFQPEPVPFSVTITTP